MKKQTIPVSKPKRLGKAPSSTKGHTRMFIGGPIDERSEYAPGLIVRQIVHKSEWDMSRSINNYHDWRVLQGRCKHHYYKLQEPTPKRADNGATYVYQYAPDYQPETPANLPI